MTDLPKDDAILVENAQRNPEEFGVIYERYVHKIYTYIYYRTGNVHDAEDLTTTVFMQAMNHLPRYTNRGLPFSAWLYRIAHNLVSNWYRDQKRREDANIESKKLTSNPKDNPDSVTVTNEETEMLLEAIRSLPADRQELLILKFVERLSNKEIGKMMRRSEGAIKSLYHRTLMTLRKNLNNKITK
ncbi:MAG TPA: RNA polymerase subunit sigma-24 [Chloroflexi bacterium]|nr:RNA polymerase subunit sigma-24 [Chloroflexota bacterium]